MNITDILTAKYICHRDYATINECVATGRYIHSPAEKLAMVEIKEKGFFGAKRWVYITQLDIIKEWPN